METLFNLLEGHVQLLVVNAQHIKAVPGRKTDVRDAEWIADLLQHGLLKASFIPPAAQRELRELTRYRTTLVQERARTVNRLQKTLEDTNLKPHHRFLLKQHLAHIDTLDEALVRVGAEIAVHMRPLDQAEPSETRAEDAVPETQEQALTWAQAIVLLCSIPGISRRAAEGILAEIGIEMNRFPSAKHLASWAGMSPGNRESAGKRLSGKTNKGSPWLRKLLVEAALAASHTKHTYLAAQYKRLAARRGAKKAAIAVGHSILVIIYQLLDQHKSYEDLGGNYFDELDRQAIQKRLVRRLEKLGYEVELKPALPAA